MQLFQNRANAIAKDVGHRPWDVPRAPWVMFQSWRDVLFVHWPIDAEQLRPHVAKELAIDEFDGTAWLSLVALQARRVRLRGTPAVPGLSSFPQLNLRTYVRHRGKPGIYLFTADVPSRLMALVGRTLYRQPFQRADIRMASSRQGVCVASRSGGAELVASYQPIGSEFEARPATLDYFLTERYAAYSTLAGGVLRAEIQHRPWRLRSAVAEIDHDTVPRAHGIELPDMPPTLHYAARQDAVLWPPVLSRTGRRLVPVYG